MNTTFKKTAVLATCLLSSLPAGAAADPLDLTNVSPYQMAVVIDRSHGQAVLNGDYETAIETLQGKEGGSFNVSTNLCVAYTLTGSQEKAHGACATAVEISARRVRHTSAMSKVSDLQQFAVALSNQGVLKAISGDPAGAAQDFVKAVKLQTGHGPAESNLEKFLALDTTADLGLGTGV